MEYKWIKIKKPLLDWYASAHRQLPWRMTKNPYHIWISEIMLQQTRVEAVKGYYSRFLKEIPDVETLAGISEERLLKLWEGLGYYNRARNLQKAAVQIMEDYQGEFPVEYEQVLGLPGIGDYTAGAICSISYGLPTPAVDGNVLRVMTRASEWNACIDDASTKKKAREILLALYEKGDCSNLTQALMELGAVVCIPNGEPKCEECPLRTMCMARKNGTYSTLPVRKEKKQRRIEEKTVFVLHVQERYGIRKRVDQGLLAGMWEFPHVNARMSPSEAMTYLSKQGFEPILLEKEVPYTHIFSHVEWRMKAYYVECHNLSEELNWVARKDLEEVYALPTAFKAFWEKE